MCQLKAQLQELRKTVQDKEQEIQGQGLRVVLPEHAVRAQSALVIEQRLDDYKLKRIASSIIIIMIVIMIIRIIMMIIIIVIIIIIIIIIIIVII